MRKTKLTDEQIAATRKWFTNPAGWEGFAEEALPDGGVIFTGFSTANTFRSGRPVYMLTAFRGRTTKPLHGEHCLFGSEASRDARATGIRESVNAKLAADAQKALDRKKPHTLKVGDILVCSWGYDQTNIDFYRVKAVRGALVDFEELAQEQAGNTRQTHDDRGQCQPTDKTTGKVVFSKRPNFRNEVKMFTWGGYAVPWDGRPRYWSSYA